MITFTELNRTGDIVLGRYDNANGMLTYETRHPGQNAGKVQICRSQDLEKCARIYWNAVAEMVDA